MKNKMIFGFHAVTSRLRHEAQSVEEIFVDATRQDRRMQDLIANAKSAGVRVMPVDAERLDKIVGTRRHQGVIAFASQLTLSFFWPLPLVLLVFGALLMAVIWSRLEEMKMPVLTFIGMTLVMVWLAGELWFARPTNTALSGFAGAALLLLSNAVWLVSHYRRRFRADNAIAAAFYFAGHFLIVRALYL